MGFRHNLQIKFFGSTKHLELISDLEIFVAMDSRSTFTFYMITLLGQFCVERLFAARDKCVVICDKQYHVIDSSSVFVNFRITVCVDSIHRQHDTTCLLRNIIH